MRGLGRDIRCGLADGFPVCCVFFYSFVLRFLDWTRTGLGFKYREHAIKPGIGYVRCPSCLLFRKPRPVLPALPDDAYRMHPTDVVKQYGGSCENLGKGQWKVVHAGFTYIFTEHHTHH